MYELNVLLSAVKTPYVTFIFDTCSTLLTPSHLPNGAGGESAANGTPPSAAAGVSRTDTALASLPLSLSPAPNSTPNPATSGLDYDHSSSAAGSGGGGGSAYNVRGCMVPVSVFTRCVAVSEAEEAGGGVMVVPLTKRQDLQDSSLGTYYH